MTGSLIVSFSMLMPGFVWEKMTNKHRDVMIGLNMRTEPCWATRGPARTRSRSTPGGGTCSGIAPTVFANVKRLVTTVIGIGHLFPLFLTLTITW